MTLFTTIEKLALKTSSCYDAIIRYKGFVCLASVNYKGEFTAEIFEFVDEPYEEFSEIECRISLLEKATETFTNSGEAIKWCFEFIDRK